MCVCFNLSRILCNVCFVDWCPWTRLISVAHVDIQWNKTGAFQGCSPCKVIASRLLALNIQIDTLNSILVLCSIVVLIRWHFSKYQEFSINYHTPISKNWALFVTHLFFQWMQRTFSKLWIDLLSLWKDSTKEFPRLLRDR